MKKIKKIALIIGIAFVVIWVSVVAFGVNKYGGWSEYWNYMDIETHRDIRYYEKIVQDGELTIYFKDHNGINHEISWGFEKGEIVNYYASHIKFNLHKLWDARFINNLTLGRSDISFESPENKGQDLNGKDLMWKNKLELSFDAPKDSTESNFKCKGKVKVTYDTGSSSTYDAEIKVILRGQSSTSINQQENNEPTQDDKAITKVEQGEYCYQFDDLKVSGKFYYCKLKVENTVVSGEITVENEASESYTVKFNGENKEGKLLVKTTYDNDAGGPYDETWGINQDKLTLEQPSVTLTKIDCN